MTPQPVSQPVSQLPPGCPPPWPARRPPGWLIAALAALLAGAVLVGLAHRPTTGQRAADLRAVIHALNTGIESCAGGVRDSLTALRAIRTGVSSDTATAISIAREGATNCSPANNQQLADLIQYQVPESLALFNLDDTVNDLVTWAFPRAQAVQNAVVSVLSAHGAQARDRAQQALRTALAQLDAQRAVVNGSLGNAMRTLGLAGPPPSLPG
jgi:hypothetical protein